MSGAAVEKLDSQPAYRGPGGYSGSGSPYGNPRSSSQDYRRDQYKNALQQRQQQMGDAKNKRLAEPEAECNRNRGTDCSNPEALRYIESTKIPRPYRRWRDRGSRPIEPRGAPALAGPARVLFLFARF